MNNPIFLNDHGDVSVFNDVESLKLYVEPIDVKNGEYQAFCADGTRLNLSVQEDVVLIACESNSEKEANKLLTLINNFFKSAKPGVGEFNNLEIAVSAFIENFGLCR